MKCDNAFFVKVFSIACFRCFRVRGMYTQRKIWWNYFSLIDLRASLWNWLQTVPALTQWSPVLAFHPMFQREEQFLFSIVNFHQKEVQNCKYRYRPRSSYCQRCHFKKIYLQSLFLLAFRICSFYFSYLKSFSEGFYDRTVVLDQDFFATAIGIQTLTRIPYCCILRSTFSRVDTRPSMNPFRTCASLRVMFRCSSRTTWQSWRSIGLRRTRGELRKSLASLAVTLLLILHLIYDSCMQTVCFHWQNALHSVFRITPESLVYSWKYLVVLLWKCVSIGNCEVSFWLICF